MTLLDNETSLQVANFLRADDDSPMLTDFGSATTLVFPSFFLFIEFMTV